MLARSNFFQYLNEPVLPVLS